MQAFAQGKPCSVTYYASNGMKPTLIRLDKVSEQGESSEITGHKVPQSPSLAGVRAGVENKNAPQGASLLVTWRA